jgi:predicted phosphate transport protein (TIGR00153 family)
LLLKTGEPAVAFRLTPKEDSFYDLFAVSASHLVDAAKELTNLLAVQDPESARAVVERMHDLEHLGDEATHEIIRRVNSSFITPFDREDIHMLASRLDDCMDHMEEAADMVDLYKVTEFPKGVAKQIEIIGRMADLTATAMPRLRSMQDLSQYWIEINRLENQADKHYRRLVANLFEHTDAIHVLKMKDIVTALESAADAFEAVANTVEGIAIKES